MHKKARKLVGNVISYLEKKIQTTSKQTPRNYKFA